MRKENRAVTVIPGRVLSRLTKYLAHVQRLRHEGWEWVSSQAMAHSLGLTSSTVRQDLSYVDFSGTCRRGYETKKLEWALYKELGADRVTNVAIVGAGNLGRALALHAGFERGGFPVCAIFDADERVVGKRIGEMTVRPMSDLGRVFRERRIDIGILAVPGAAAREAARAVIKAGARGLLNLSPAHIEPAGGVPVVDVRIVAGLQELLYFMNVRARGQKARRSRS